MIRKRFGDPGSTQTQGEHGWFTVGTAPAATFGDIGHFTPTATDAQMSKAMALLAARGVTTEQVQQNLKDMYANGLAKGMDSHEWYEAEHDATMQWVDHGYSDIQAAGMLAATTANVSWSKTFAGDTPNFSAGTTIYSNLTAAATCAAYVTDNPMLDITQAQADTINAAKAAGANNPTYGGQPMDENSDPPYAPLQAGQVQASQLSDYQLGKWASMSGNSMIPGVPIGYPDSVMRGVEIARGADPSDVLTGYKEQSFMNNVAFPDEETTATIDSHMSQGMLPMGGVTLQGADAQNWNGQGFPIVQQFDADGDPRVDGKGNNVYKDYARDFVGTPAGYTYCAQLVVQAAQSAGMVPNQYQAVAWAGVVQDEKSLKNSKLDVAKSFVNAPFINDDVYTPDQIAQFDADMKAAGPFDTKFIAAHTVTSLNFKTPAPDDTVSAFADIPKWFKGFGDPGSTQTRDAHGEFGPGSGAVVVFPADAKRIYNSESLASLRSSQSVDAHGDPILNVGTKYTNADDAAKYANSLVQKYGGDAAKDANIDVKIVPDGQLGQYVTGQTFPPSPGLTGPMADAMAASGMNVGPQPNWQISLAQNDADQQTVIHETAHVLDAVTAASSRGISPVGFAAWTDLMGHGNAFNNAYVPMLQGEMPEFAQQYQMAMVRAGGLQGKSAPTVRAVITTPSGSQFVCNAPSVTKGFGDPGSTQQQDAHGRFTAGSGAASNSLEDKAIAHFGAADELVGQQYITPNGTILNLEGDGHYRMREVMGGRMDTVTSRAVNAGFLRTSFDQVTTSMPGQLGMSLAMEFSQPLTSAQIGAVMQGIKDGAPDGLAGIAIDVPSSSSVYSTNNNSATLLFSDEQSDPTRSDVAGMIRDANVAAGAPVNAEAFAELLKGFGDPGSTQQQDAHGRFTVGSGAPRDAASLKYPELHARDMTAGGTNSPLMTRAEFQASAARGEDIVNSAIANGSPPVNMMTGPNIQAAVDEAQREWGGVTIDAHGGGVVSQASQPPDPLSVSMRDEGQGSVIVSAAIAANDPGTLMAAMQQAQTQFADQLSAQGAALGMFRDMTTGTLQFDPVLVVQGVATARDVGAYTGATGGAYRFSDGNGYWPGHVA